MSGDVFTKLSREENMHDARFLCGTPSSKRLSKLSKWQEAQAFANFTGHQFAHVHGL
jgi:hypothetical protein